ncbi:uncharacterized protein [Argopecten irradians]|uniref:uncharacterized protein n=1 Tax=Argopecten irradians TaxID=31199 RepID=UPI003717ADC1
MSVLVWCTCLCFLLTCFGQIGCQSACQQEQQLIATTTEQFITSPGYPNNYDSNLNCSWRISAGLQRCPHAVIVEVRRVELEFFNDTLKFTSDYTPTYHILDDGIYVFPGVLRVLFRTDVSKTEKGFNISYKLEDLTLTTSTTVYGCEAKALLAEVQSKEIRHMLQSNNSKVDIRVPCYWLVYVTDPCLTIREGTRQIMEVVVEEFTSHGWGTIYISHQNHGIMTIGPKSALMGRSLHFYMSMNEVVLISAYGDYFGKGSPKISYKLVSTVESSEYTVWYFSTISIGVALLLSVIAHVLVCLICRKRLRTKAKVMAINMEMSTKETKLKTQKRPYVNMGDDHENVHGQDAFYENSDGYMYAFQQDETDDIDDTDDYENIQREDYINASVFSKRD